MQTADTRLLNRYIWIIPIRSLLVLELNSERLQLIDHVNDTEHDNASADRIGGGDRWGLSAWELLLWVIPALLLPAVGLSLSQCTEPTASKVRTGQQLEQAAPLQSLRLDLNSASEEQLMLLPGIGRTRAAQIVALRQKKGRFRHLNDLLEIQGIGTGTLARIGPLVEIRADE